MSRTPNFSSQHVGRRVGLRNAVRNGLTMSNSDPKYTGVIIGGDVDATTVKWDDGIVHDILNDELWSTVYVVRGDNR